MPLIEDLAAQWEVPEDYSTRPADWCADRGGEYMWGQQRRIMGSVVEHRYTAVHSAHDMGKSKVAANIATWWIDSHPPGSAFVVSTAPTAAQVSAILWREITKMKTKTDAPGRINRAGYPQWYVGDVLVGYGRKPADYEESAFQGIHERYVLVILDEACGIAKHLFDAVDALATNEDARVLAIGNPDDPGSHFASVCKPDSDWNVIHLDGLRSPNMTKERIIGRKSQGYGYANPKHPLLTALMEAEQIPYNTEQVPEDLRPLLISELWIEERIRRWAGLGKDAHHIYTQTELRDIVQRRCASTPIFQAKVRGVFPSAGSEGVIPLGWVELAMNRWHDAMDTDSDTRTSLKAAQAGRKVLGVDVARGGEDETAIAFRYGSLIEKIVRSRQADTVETANLVASEMNEPGVVAVIDVVGIGAGVYDMLRRMAADSQIQGRPLPFTASAQSGGRDAIGEFRFRNDRSRAWWRMRELLDPSRGSLIALPDDERLKEELVAPRYKLHVGGIIVVESKDDIKKRLGRSTDSADAVIQSFEADGDAELPEPVAYGESQASNTAFKYAGNYDAFTEDDMLIGPGLQGSRQATSIPSAWRPGADNGWDIF